MTVHTNVDLSSPFSPTRACRCCERPSVHQFRVMEINKNKQTGQLSTRQSNYSQQQMPFITTAEDMLSRETETERKRKHRYGRVAQKLNFSFQGKEENLDESMKLILIDGVFTKLWKDLRFCPLGHMSCQGLSTFISSAARLKLTGL